MKTSGHGITDIGRKRPRNDDSVYKGGDVASREIYDASRRHGELRGMGCVGGEHAAECAA